MTVPDTPGPDWVAALSRVDPDLYAQLLRARIRDEGATWSGSACCRAGFGP
jgi:hypothetical protein